MSSSNQKGSDVALRTPSKASRQGWLNGSDSKAAPSPAPVSPLPSVTPLSTPMPATPLQIRDTISSVNDMESEVDKFNRLVSDMNAFLEIASEVSGIKCPPKRTSRDVEKLLTEAETFEKDLVALYVFGHGMPLNEMTKGQAF